MEKPFVEDRYQSNVLVRYDIVALAERLNIDVKLINFTKGVSEIYQLIF